MTDQNLQPSEVTGASTIVDAFGFWPSFHDAEIVELHLVREGLSKVVVELYVQTKKATVCFKLKNVVELCLDNFNHQNVLFDLTLTKTEIGYKLIMEPSFGLSGQIESEDIQVELLEVKNVVES